MHRPVRPGGVRAPLILIFAVVAIAAWVLAAAGPAAAVGPTGGTTMNLTDLQTAITAAGPGGLDGYFKTVLQGATISVVPVKVLAVADGENPIDGSALILFEITDDTPVGATVLAQGGFAEGMSGSPLYVGDASDPQADDPLVGATSWGGEFVTSGLGFATPIEFMESIETKYQVAPLGAGLGALGAQAAPLLETAGPVLPRTHAVTLARPVKTAAGTFKRFVIARNARVARTLHPTSGTAVFRPLGAVEVGGLPSTSKAFQRLSNAFAKRGVDVHAVGAGMGDHSGFATDLVSGASVAAVYASGAVWMAGIGTVTYVDSDDPATPILVAFGHPADLDGPVGLDMANAWIDGIWSNSIAPSKLGSLGAIQGLFTQDRTYGVAGVIGAAHPEVPVDASATLGTNPTVQTHTDVPLWVADNPDYGSYLISGACYAPVFTATDAFAFPGHATMDSSVTIADSLNAGQTYTTEMKNVFDDTYDVGYYAGMDVGDMLDYLLSNPNGVAPATAQSVSFAADLSPTDYSRQILDFAVPGGLKHGDNTIRTYVRDYGRVGTHEVDLTLNVPSDVKTTGTLTVYDSNGMSSGANDSSWFYADGSSGTLGQAPLGDASTIPDAETLTGLVADVNGWLLNDSLNATFIADVSNSFVVPTRPDGTPVNQITVSQAQTDGGQTWYVAGNVSKSSTSMRLRPGVPIVAPRHSVKLIGTIDAEDSDATTVDLYRGSSATPFATVPVHVDAEGLGHFSAKVKLGTSTTTFKAVWGGSDSYLGATASCKVRVMH